MRRPSVVEMLLGLALGTYFALAAWQIALPGPYYDEALHAPAAVSLLNGDGRRQGYGVTLRRWYFPVMTGEYVGALRTYLLLPAFFVIGPGVVAHRLTTIILTLIGLIFTAALARRAFGDRAAVLGVWLISTDPTLILATRGDWGPVAAGFMLRMGAFYFAWLWWESGGRRTYALAAAAALLGLGVYDKAHFLWIVCALIGLAAIAWSWSWRHARARPTMSWGQAGLAVTAWIVGGAPFWVYNLTHDWITFRLAALPGEPASLEMLLAKLPGRTRVLEAMFDAQALAHWMTGEWLAPHFGWRLSLLLPLTLAALGGLVVGAIWARRADLPVLPILAAMLLGQMFLTPRPIWIHHLIAIYPLPHLAVGLAVALLWNAARTKRRQILAGVAVAAVCLAVGFNLLTMAGFHRKMSAGAVSEAWSDAVYTLAEKLEGSYAGRRIQLLDWGIYNQLDLITAGRLDLREPVYEILNAREPVAAMSALAADPRNLFVLHASESTVFNEMELQFQEAVRQSGLTLKAEDPIRDRRTRIVYRIVDFVR